ncbi:FmdB family zinc ribbon protein [Roseisolibacter agri]|uniref:Putative regulatory protein FmdB zinc ribbon domain-containing protein n=1 Tax=Roseisolibacter agri TaxID=2014610 RepID=A0AA37VBJ8_9BACT|nr:zinc ribbon domain-containing protein [Roseisolibacter agri]GLC26518.1 hypothetical protein rosag_30310 [Roseisolibacter agri]
MPTYEFRCPNGHNFEQFHRISDAPSTAECPTCGAVAERAISGGAGLVFKGSGFYLTDYGKNAHRTSGPANKSSAESSSSSSSGNGASGGESKPASPKSDGSATSSSGGSASKASE